MKDKIRKFGWGVLAAGVLLLLCGLILSIMVGGNAAPVLLFCSILTNTAAITMLRYRKK